MPKLAFQTLVIFVGATIALGIFNSASLVTWAYDLPANTLSDGIVTLAEVWHDAMIDLGPARLTEIVRDQIGLITGDV
ncbi:MAG: hypothetical protein AAFW47_05225 [Pseudomonadota bacterium]